MEQMKWAGDFVKIAGDFYHIIKTNPSVADDLLKGSGEDLPPIITDNQVNTGVGTEPVLITPTKAKAMIEKHSTGNGGYRCIKHRNFF
jgi:hypothetical protein